MRKSIIEQTSQKLVYKAVSQGWHNARITVKSYAIVNIIYKHEKGHKLFSNHSPVSHPVISPPNI